MSQEQNPMESFGEEQPNPETSFLRLPIIGHHGFAHSVHGPHGVFHGGFHGGIHEGIHGGIHGGLTPFILAPLLYTAAYSYDSYPYPYYPSYYPYDAYDPYYPYYP